MRYDNVENNHIKEKIFDINFTRMKYYVLIYLGFFLYMVITDYLFSGIWNIEFLNFYRKVDLAAVISGLILFYFFWIHQLKILVKKKWLFNISLIANLVFAPLITGIEFTSLGFSTYIFVLLVLTFFFYLDAVITLVYFLFSFLILLGTIFLMGSFEALSITLIFMLLNIIVVSVFISYRNYQAKINDLKNQEQVLSMNKELESIKENLEKEVDSRTKEISIANEELKKSVAHIKKINEELTIAKQKAEESDHLKTVFLNNMSHEIRTPLNGIMGFSELIGKPNLKTEKRAFYSHIIRTSSAQLLHIIDDILEISTLEVKQVKIMEEKVNVDKLLEKLFAEFEPLAREKNIEFTLQEKTVEPGKNIILSDTRKLEKVLQKLIDNAVKFTFKGMITIGYKIDDDIVQFYVKDTGIGISGQDKTVIFKRFAKGNKHISQQVGGLGIGLSIACENAKLLGGYITMESKQEIGSTFQLIIPNKQASIEDSIKENEKKIPKLNGNGNTPTILIAEDENSNFLLIKEILEEFMPKIHLIHALNGLEALNLCQKNYAIQMIIMDLKMPVMDGFEATSSIRKIKHDLPIIAFTAYSSPNDKEKALAAGCNAFLTKPVDKAELINTLHSFL